MAGAGRIAPGALLAAVVVLTPVLTAIGWWMLHQGPVREVPVPVERDDVPPASGSPATSSVAPPLTSTPRPAEPSPSPTSVSSTKVAVTRQREESATRSSTSRPEGATSPAAPPRCGDETVSGTETCDDGNEDPLDGCAACRRVDVGVPSNGAGIVALLGALQGSEREKERRNLLQGVVNQSARTPELLEHAALADVRTIVRTNLQLDRAVYPRHRADGAVASRLPELRLAPEASSCPEVKLWLSWTQGLLGNSAHPEVQRFYDAWCGTCSAPPPDAPTSEEACTARRLRWLRDEHRCIHPYADAFKLGCGA